MTQRRRRGSSRCCRDGARAVICVALCLNMARRLNWVWGRGHQSGTNYGALLFPGQLGWICRRDGDGRPEHVPTPGEHAFGTAGKREGIARLEFRGHGALTRCNSRAYHCIVLDRTVMTVWWRHFEVEKRVSQCRHFFDPVRNTVWVVTFVFYEPGWLQDEHGFYQVVARMNTPLPTKRSLASCSLQVRSSLI